MRPYIFALIISGVGLAVTGCSTQPRQIGQAASNVGQPVSSTFDASATPSIVQAGYFAEDRVEQAQALANGPPETVSETPQTIGLPELIEMTVARNPRLAQVAWAIETARGQAIQAGLYPNPTVNVTGNELGDRTGPSGIWSVYTSQEIVTANKLDLSQAAALKQVDQATLNLMSERYRVFTDVRQAFFEAATLQNRSEILTNLVELAQQSTENAEKLLLAKEAAQIDVIQLEVDLERYRAELDATQQALPAAYRKLAASIGVQDLALPKLEADFEMLPPDLELEAVRTYILGVHPDVRSAMLGVERAQILVKRAEVETIPNITVGAGYTRQGQNRSNDGDFGVSLPFPLWNKNQGNIRAAKARVGEAINQVGQVQNDLVTQLATAYGSYTAARKRAERYKTAIIPKSQQTYELAFKAYQGGEFEYLRVLQAQRTVAEARLEYVRSLSEMWRSASAIAGLMLEDQWPPAPPRNQP